MNRLVIVGNGFDLAHGLPTGYCDFIDWYWRKVFSNSKLHLYTLDYEDELITFKAFFSNSYSDKAFRAFLEINTFTEFENFKSTLTKSSYHGFNHDLNIQNDFFAIINEHRQKNWVDIENEYYKLLKDCLNERNNNSMVIKLNEEFEEVKDLFQKYLEDVVEKIEYSEKINDAIVKLFVYKFDDGMPRSYNQFDEVLHPHLKEFPKKVHEKLIDFNKKLNPVFTAAGIFTRPLTLFLNFNYTSLVRAYINIMNKNDYDFIRENQIHGSLEKKQIAPTDNNLRNKIIFGFGDEMDDDYKAIEKKNENAYFKNIKSFGYFQTSDYRDLRASIDTGDFQVLIMGHSCGLSDRVLLNTIFEHPNCCSIKVFYHENKEKQTDNYNDIVQNISRHFNQKEMMRERIVPKNLCVPLPQAPSKQ